MSSRSKLRLLITLECSFLHNNILGETDQSILHQVMKYISDFCEKLLNLDDSVSLDMLNVEGTKSMHFEYRGSQEINIEELTAHCKETTQIKPFSLYDMFQTSQQLASVEMDTKVVAIMFCSSVSYIPLDGIELLRLQNLREKSVQVNVIDINIAQNKDQIYIDCFNLGTNYYQTNNIKKNLSDNFAKTFYKLFAPIKGIWVFDTCAIIDMKLNETNRVLDYINSLGHLICFPREVIMELDHKKKDAKLEKHVRRQQKMMGSLGFLRYNEPVFEIKKYIDNLSLKKSNNDEKIVLNAKYLKEHVCSNIMLVSNDYHVHSLGMTYEIKIYHQNELRDLYDGVNQL